MIKIKDIVKYKTFMNPKGCWGMVKEIIEIKESTEEERKGKELYRVTSLEDKGLSHYDAMEEEILEVYSKEV